jgi:hypothetical protein
VRSLASCSAFAAVIECASVLFAVSFLNHGRFKADTVAEDDCDVDAKDPGVVMMVVESKDAIRRRTEGKV